MAGQIGQSSRFWRVAYVGMIVMGVWLLYRHPDARPFEIAMRVGLVLMGGLGLLASRFTPQSTAKRMLDRQKAVYSERHEYQQVDSSALRGFDLEFYAANQAYFESQGFRFVADIENLTATRLFPGMRGIIRMLTGDAGTVMVGIFHVRTRGFFRLAQAIGLIPRQLKCVDLETELSDGTFVTTSSARESVKTADVPGIHRHLLPSATPAAELLRLHRENVRLVLARDASVQPLRLAGYADMIESQHRMQELKSAYKRDVGFIDRRDIELLADGDLTPAHEAVIANIEALKKDDLMQAPAPPSPDR